MNLVKEINYCCHICENDHKVKVFEEKTMALIKKINLWSIKKFLFKY